MNWAEVIAHPSLQDLPFKIELNEYGQVVMNPVKIKHSYFQGRISRLLEDMRSDGIASPEFAIWTKKGTKAADVAWTSLELWDKLKDEDEASIAPEICVEVVSISNTNNEMKEKRKLYFEQGAKEVWICDEYGNVSFYDENGKLEQSQMFPDFPLKVSYK